MITALIDHERRTVLATGTGVIIAAALALLGGYAACSGAAWRADRTASLDAFAQRLDGKLQEHRDILVAIESGQDAKSPYDARPMNLQLPAVLPPGPLGDFAVGHSDLMPASAEVSLWRNATNIFGHYQFDSPTSLASGRFDLAFVIVVLVPLFLIAFTFNVVAADKERGTLALILAQPVTLTQVVWTRLLVRGLALWAVLAAVSAVAAVVGGDGLTAERLTRFALWLAVVTVYMAVWLAVISWIVSYMWSAPATVLALLFAWVAVVFVVPASARAIAEMAYPPPSRLAYLSDARRAANEASNLPVADLTRGFLVDHPELTVADNDVPAFYQRAFLYNRVVDQRVRGALERYAVTHAEQRRFLDWAQYLSPAISVQTLLNEVAGADVHRQRAYQHQARALLYDLQAYAGPAVVAKKRLRVTEFNALPRLHWQEPSTAAVARRIATPLVYLGILGLGCAALAHRRMRRRCHVHADT